MCPGRCVAGCGAFLVIAVSAFAQQPATGSARIRFVAEARQLGPVGYRDPIGVMSPDGEWLAYASGGRLRVTPVAGGAVSTLGTLARVAAVAWRPDSRRVAHFEVDTAGNSVWFATDIPGGARRPLWTGPFARAWSGSDSVSIDPNRFREIAWSRDGAQLAAWIPQPRGALLWTGGADGSRGRVTRIETRVGSLAWSPDGKTLACLIGSNDKQYVSVPCGVAPGPDAPEAYGALAFSADGTKLYYASPNARGTLDLWVRPTSGGRGTRLTSFARDTYGPSVSRNGRVLFATQDYRTFVAVVPADGGVVKQLTTFQSETPTWSRDDRQIGVTYGTWRRIVDDLKYPDIAQDLGSVSSTGDVPASGPLRVIRASSSEDQGLDWSPNGHWIVLHSHEKGLDDVWIQPADGSAPARAITTGGTETGWPRWSPNGAWIAYGTEIQDGNRLRGVLYTVGVDSATGRVTREARRVPIDGLRGDVDQVEWSPGSDSLVFDVAETRGERAIYVVARDGGTPRLVHRFTSEQQFSGIGVAPNFRWAAFVAPANDGHFQIFRIPMSGGTPTQVTFDATDKTQPAVSHDGTRIAFTVFTYRMQFWLMEP
jgi:Tol biopolymer transport system component